MRRKPPPDLATLKSLYHYNRLTGDFTHKRNTGRGKKGQLAGLLRQDGYVSISINGIAYLAQHLAWFIQYGEWLPQIDHKNRCRADNRIKNLRPATRAQNNGNSDGWAQEKRKHKLPRGVYHYSQCPGRYRAQIVADHKQIHLGCFDSIEEAEAAYEKAAAKFFGQFWRSNNGQS